MTTIRNKAGRRLLGAAVLLASLFPVACSSTPDQLVFDSPQSAVAASMAAIRANDDAKLKEIFGPESDDVISSGDPVADQEGRRRFLEQFEDRNNIEMSAPDMATLAVGPEDWPFPIPLVKDEAGWRFDTEAGREVILARRIGRNELATIEVCRALIDAELEYAEKDRDGDGILEYAMKLRSAPGKKDGLWWPTMAGEAPSPMGELVAAASARGYELDRDKTGPEPFNGYLFKLLREQGPHAKGGAFSYMAGDQMIGGFACIAFPARYEDSGIMSFTFSHSGVVYQKDLGYDTEDMVDEMTVFDPDDTWTKIERN